MAWARGWGEHERWLLGGSDHSMGGPSPLLELWGTSSYPCWNFGFSMLSYVRGLSEFERLYVVAWNSNRKRLLYVQLQYIHVQYIQSICTLSGPLLSLLLSSSMRNKSHSNLIIEKKKEKKISIFPLPPMICLPPSFPHYFYSLPARPILLANIRTGSQPASVRFSHLSKQPMGIGQTRRFARLSRTTRFGPGESKTVQKINIFFGLIRSTYVRRGCLFAWD